MKYRKWTKVLRSALKKISLFSDVIEPFAESHREHQASSAATSGSLLSRSWTETIFYVSCFSVGCGLVSSPPAQRSIMSSVCLSSHCGTFTDIIPACLRLCASVFFEMTNMCCVECPCLFTRCSQILCSVCVCVCFISLPYLWSSSYISLISSSVCLQ